MTKKESKNPGQDCLSFYTNALSKKHRYICSPPSSEEIVGQIGSFNLVLKLYFWSFWNVEYSSIVITLMPTLPGLAVLVKDPSMD